MEMFMQQQNKLHILVFSFHIRIQEHVVIHKMDLLEF